MNPERELLTLEVVSPQRAVLTATVEHIVIPAEDGYLGILPRHAPMVVALKAGVVEYRSEGQTHRLAVGGGFCEVLGDRTLILADSAELSEEIDVERARTAYDRAMDQLDRELSGDEHIRAEVALQRALARLQAAGAVKQRRAYGGRPGGRRMPPAHERDQ